MDNLVLGGGLGLYRSVIIDDLLSQVLDFIQLTVMNLKLIDGGFLEKAAKEAHELPLFGLRALCPVASEAAAGDGCPIDALVEFFSNQLPCFMLQYNFGRTTSFASDRAFDNLQKANLPFRFLQ